MKYRKEKIYSITKRLYADIRNNRNIIFKKLRGCHGEYDEVNEEVLVDYRKEMLPTVVHEYLHRWYPKRNENWVIREEEKIMNALTQNQVKNLLRVIVDSVN